MVPAPTSPEGDRLNRVLSAAATASRETAYGDVFYRQLAQHLARDATTEFQRNRSRQTDAKATVAGFVQHEENNGHLASGEITVKGEGFHVAADVHQCPYRTTCHSNLIALGEVPQCIRAITLIEAISAKIPARPPMSYDLDPGLVDGSSDACHIELRPAGSPPIRH